MKELPMGIVCKECGQVIASLILKESLADKQRVVSEVVNNIVCSACINRMIKEAGVIPNSAENWEKVLEKGKNI